MRMVLIGMRTISDSSLEHPSKPPHRLMYYVTRGNLATSKATFFIWVFPKIGVHQNGWFIMEIPIEMDDLGGKATIFGNPPYCSNPQIFTWQVVGIASMLPPPEVATR